MRKSPQFSGARTQAQYNGLVGPGLGGKPSAEPFTASLGVGQDLKAENAKQTL